MVRRRSGLLLCTGLLACLLSLGAVAKDAAPVAADPALEAHMLKLANELRCLVCQNQTIADSHAGLAEDLREEIRVMLRKGVTDDQVVTYMTDRYGDFVRYRPPIKATTWLLWFGPGTLLFVGVVSLIIVLRRRSRMTDDRFEPDYSDADEPGEALP